MRPREIAWLAAAFAYWIAPGHAHVAHASVEQFDYVCIQPNDRIEITIPAVPLARIPSATSLLPAYSGRNLFERDTTRADRWRFTPIPGTELELQLRDYEGEVIFDSVRFVRSGDRLYTWISMTASRNPGVLHRAVALLRDRGVEIARRKAIDIEIRNDLRDCN